MPEESTGDLSVGREGCCEASCIELLVIRGRKGGEVFAKGYEVRDLAASRHCYRPPFFSLPHLLWDVGGMRWWRPRLGRRMICRKRWRDHQESTILRRGENEAPYFSPTWRLRSFRSRVGESVFPALGSQLCSHLPSWAICRGVM